ncbi:MAG: CpsD/CapB family tyrosine-protein kinase [Clostridiales bacterium]|jgi:capsular exopolysaccharide synthesis family protein|nr:CpsD/CapB family tyrosine-protein kinase [Clostridiales bacterium]
MLKFTELIAKTNPKSPIAEAYRVLRTNIQFSSPDRELKVILITSSGPDEGKSITSSNLAITMAQSNMKVLLIDCDLRKPIVHRAFGLVNMKGLTNVLVEGIDYSSVINVTDVENLHIITSGPKPPNPAELLGSRKMEEFLRAVREDYDIIIADTPPVLPVTDAAVLCQYADGVVLVAGHGMATYDAILRTKANLERVNANILGVVLNGAPIARNGYSYYYYYYDEAGDGVKQKRRRKNGGLPFPPDSTASGEGVNV